MADGTEEDTPMRSADEEEESGNTSDSGSESEEEEVEWLATTREKRSTAGNRLTSLIQQEGEDDELELLFAEDEDDAGFEDAEDAGSDVHMDSSDDDEDQGPTAGADDLEGEKELQRQAKAEKTKKRKANDHIPKAFLAKKARIDPTALSNSTPPRPKKKSERASWIPTAEDAPTRASMRRTTKKSKEQLYKQMIDREKRRLKQLENMEKAAKRKEAEKPREITQEDRLAEAARIEKKNARSLNRWEEAEKQREEEQRAKLAALHNRKLAGPVVTWWSGMTEWVSGKLKHVGKNVTIEEKEKIVPKKKKVEVVEEASKADGSYLVEDDSALPLASTLPTVNANTTSSTELQSTETKPVQEPAKPAESVSEILPPSTGSLETALATPKPDSMPVVEDSLDEAKDSAAESPATKHELPPASSVTTELPQSNAQTTTTNAPSDASISIGPAELGIVGDLKSKPTSSAESSIHNVSTVPSPYGTGPLPQPTTQVHPQEIGLALTPSFSQQPTVATSQDIGAKVEVPAVSSLQAPLSGVPITYSPTNISIALPNSNIATVTIPLDSVQSICPQQSVIEGPSTIDHSTRNCLILQNFNENAIRNKDVPMKVLFGRTFEKATKASEFLQFCFPACKLINLRTTST